MSLKHVHCFCWGGLQGGDDAEQRAAPRGTFRVPLVLVLWWEEKTESIRGSCILIITSEMNSAIMLPVSLYITTTTDYWRFDGTGLSGTEQIKKSATVNSIALSSLEVTSPDHTVILHDCRVAYLFSGWLATVTLLLISYSIMMSLFISGYYCFYSVSFSPWYVVKYNSLVVRESTDIVNYWFKKFSQKYD